MIRLVSIIFLTASISSILALHHDQNLNNTCIDLNFEKLHENFESAFAQISDIPAFNFAQVMYQVENSESDKNYEVAVRYTKKERTFLRSVNVLASPEGELLGINQGPLMVMDNVKLMDIHADSGASAILTENLDGEQFLTVNTSRARTSCTLKLSMNQDIFRRVFTEGVFANFKFSHNGRYEIRLLY